MAVSIEKENTEVNDYDKKEILENTKKNYSFPENFTQLDALHLVYSEIWSLFISDLESKIRHQDEDIQNLEASNLKMHDSLDQLTKRFNQSERERQAMRNRYQFNPSIHPRELFDRSKPSERTDEIKKD